MIKLWLKTKLYDYFIENMFSKVVVNFRALTSYYNYFEIGEKYLKIETIDTIYHDVIVKGRGRMMHTFQETTQSDYILVWARKNHKYNGSQQIGPSILEICNIITVVK